NANRPAGCPPVYLIPGHRMMARIYDDIQADLVPGVDHISDFFSDTIHVNDAGSYAMAMIHYASIYHQSPVGLPNQLFNDSNLNIHTPPPPALAAYIQQMVWDVVTSYPRTGVGPER